MPTLALVGLGGCEYLCCSSRISWFTSADPFEWYMLAFCLQNYLPFWWSYIDATIQKLGIFHIISIMFPNRQLQRLVGSPNRHQQPHHFLQRPIITHILNIRWLLSTPPKPHHFLLFLLFLLHMRVDDGYYKILSMMWDEFGDIVGCFS